MDRIAPPAAYADSGSSVMAASSGIAAFTAALVRRLPVNAGTLATMRIDEARGLASIMVVAFHAIGSESLVHSSWAYLAQSLTFVRMPLFIAITGYLYGLRRGHRPLTFTGWSKRTGRLLPPFLLGTLVCWTISLHKGRPFEIVNGLIFGAWHLWYLQALAMILLAVWVMDKWLRPSNDRLWMVAGAAFAVVATGMFSGVAQLSVAKAAYLLPHFLVGAAIGASPALLERRRNRIAIYMAGAFGLIAHQASLLGVGSEWAKTSLVAATIGVATFTLVRTSMPASPVLRRIGAYSLPIFLWHLPVASVLSALLLHRFGTEPHIAVIAKMAFGIAVPIAAAIACARLAPQMLIFVGRRATSPSPEPAAETRRPVPALSPALA
ncbi:acyltransferase family protein [Sphingomonas mollis]|uniref:Acyltransferase n=1 Tax=Sphingomonas mollis TaxID=2795726 RepID=A0ABS0XRL3_9SPHN|nr:acyltransferase [Sphingomonas sp. BT553]MBJ6122692.1 acyltransferase [Sphingomonas sp. BT553]